jgi:hypothetical protein
VASAAVLMAGCAPVNGRAGASAKATPSASSTTSGSAIPCGTITSLRAALVNLADVKPTAQASGQIAADLVSVKAQLDALKTTAGGAYAAEARPLDQAIDHVGSAATAAVSHPSIATAAALGSALGGLKTVAQSVITEMNALCPRS